MRGFKRRRNEGIWKAMMKWGYLKGDEMRGFERRRYEAIWKAMKWGDLKGDEMRGFERQWNEGIWKVIQWRRFKRMKNKQWKELSHDWCHESSKLMTCAISTVTISLSFLSLIFTSTLSPLPYQYSICIRNFIMMCEPPHAHHTCDAVLGKYCWRHIVAIYPSPGWS